MIDDINDEFWYNYCEPVLTLLARRNLHSKEDISNVMGWFGLYKNKYNTCMICFKIIDPLFDEERIIREHGLNHLKEKKLLPFI